MTSRLDAALVAIAIAALTFASACGSSSSKNDGGNDAGGRGGGGGASAGGGNGGGGGAAGGGGGSAGGGGSGAAGAGGGTGGAAGGRGGAGGGGGTASGGGGGTGGVGGGGRGGGGGGSGGAAAGTGGVGGAGGGRGGAGGAGGGRVPCQSDTECQLFKCCNGFCVNTRNDIANCGGCNQPCGGANPFCGNGVCGTPPCNAGCDTGTFCCATACCAAGQLCCNMEVGPGFTGCANPVNGSCPQGCLGGCPCTAPTTLIATPSGARPIAELKVGDLVYSLHGNALATVPIKHVHRTHVAPTHRVVELQLAHGIVLHVTPNHPTADGRTFGDIAAGDSLDGVKVVASRVIPYGQSFTYDILPDSDSGTYVAGGVLIGSALAVPMRGHSTRVDPLHSGLRASSW